MLGAALGVGCLIGAFVAARVAMTSMPELVAMLHSFVGAAAVLVGIATYLQPGDAYEAGRSAHLVEIYIGVLVGAVTFSGSIVAFGKLRGIIGSRPLLLPGRHILNLIVAHAVRRAGRDLPPRRGAVAGRGRRHRRRGDAGAAGDDGPGAAARRFTW